MRRLRIAMEGKGIPDHLRERLMTSLETFVKLADTVSLRDEAVEVLEQLRSR